MANHGIEGIIDVSVCHDLDNDRGNFYITGNVTAQGTGRMLGLLITTDEGETCYVDGWHSYIKEFTANTNCKKQGFTPGEIGGTANGIISVGSYNTRFNYTSVEGLEYVMGGPTYTMSDLSPFSSNGPTSDGRMKPDVCAPGFGVISAAQRHAIQTGSCAYVSKDAKGNAYYYEMNAGTSMAAPYVTGSIALWLEAHPELSPDDVRNILKATCRRDNFTGEACDNRWGYGKIDTHSGLLAAINYDEALVGLHPAAADASNLRILYDRSSRSLRLCTDGSSATVYTTDGKRITSLSEPVNDLSHLAHGTYIIKISKGAATNVVKIII